MALILDLSTKYRTNSAFTCSACVQKGCGYHLDLLVVAVMLAVCSILGLPWFVAATVLSISHVNSLKVASESTAPGEQPHFLGIREQRVTGLMIFTLMGCSVFLTSALKVSALLPSFTDSLSLAFLSLSTSLPSSLSLCCRRSSSRCQSSMGFSYSWGCLRWTASRCVPQASEASPIPDLPPLTMSSCSSTTGSSCWPCRPSTSRT